MAAYTSTQTGNWADTSTWGGSGPPVSGDTATIATTHAVTVAATATVGNTATATGTDELTILGNLTINTTITFTVQGDILLDPTASGDGILTINGSGRIEVNGDYRFRFDGTDSVHALVQTSGTSSGTRAFLGGATGTDSIYFTPLAGNTFTDIIEFDLRYCDFDYVTDGNNFIDNGQHNATSAANWYFQNCKFDGCGRVRFGTGSNPATSMAFEFVDNDFRNPGHTYFIEYNTNDAFTATRRVDGNTFVGGATPNQVYIPAEIPNGNAQLSIANNIAEDTFFNNLGGGPVDFFKNLTRYSAYTGSNQDITSDSSPGGVDIDSNIVVATRANAHLVTISGAAPTTANTIKNNITFGANSADNHIGFNRATTINNNITVGGNGVVSTSANAGTVLVDRHTHINVSGNFDCSLLFETSLFTGDVTFRNSLTYGINTSGEEVIDSLSGTQTVAYVGYNCNYNVFAVYDSISITDDQSANDITDNPNLSNVSATLATWDTANGGGGTTANAFAEALKKNGFDRAGSSASFDSNYTFAAAFSYFQTAFAPSNTALQGTGLAGVDIGALAVVSGVTLPIAAYHYNHNTGSNL